MFDPDEDKDGLIRGFTAMSPEDLPNCVPARSLADNMESQNVVTGAMRTENMSRNGLNEGRVTAYDAVQFGNKAGSQDANSTGIPKAGNLKESGQGSYDSSQPKNIYDDANGEKNGK